MCGALFEAGAGVVMKRSSRRWLIGSFTVAVLSAITAHYLTKDAFSHLALWAAVQALMIVSAGVFAGKLIRVTSDFNKEKRR